MKTLIQKFQNLKIQYKIWLAMMTLLLLLVSFFYSMSYLLFKQVLTQNSLKNLQESCQDCSNRLNVKGLDYMKNLNMIISNDAFRDLLLNISKKEGSVSERTNLLQDTMTLMVSADSLIETVYLTDQNKNSYRIYGSHCKNLESLFFYDLDKINGITYFPQQKNPFDTSGDVIPVVIPLTLWNASNSYYTAFSSSAEDVILYLNLLLDAEQLNSTLAFWSHIDEGNMISLMNSSGIIYNLTDSKQKQVFELLSENPSGFQPELLLNPESSLQTKLKNGYFTAIPVYPNLYLTYLSPTETIESLFVMIRQYTSIILLAGMVLNTIAALMVSHYVTKPITHLATIVRRIQTNSYHEFLEPHSNDEVGELNQAINDMYLTIQKQIAHIRQSEQEHYHAQLALLSEQINPHLLYNSLEFINMEIYRHHEKEASAMVLSLAEYMRISLSYGDELISLQQELAHVRAYLNIMNYRFHDSIILLSFLPKDLENYRIIKTILQPFVENSIKHGFSIENGNGQTISDSPSIEIHFSHDTQFFYIEVIDNGIGFDETTLSRILMEEPTDKSRLHVGLHNVMQRLKVTYPSVDIELHSIPYYRNSIKLQLPFENEFHTEQEGEFHE